MKNGSKIIWILLFVALVSGALGYGQESTKDLSVTVERDKTEATGQIHRVRVVRKNTTDHNIEIFLKGGGSRLIVKRKDGMPVNLLKVKTDPMLQEKSNLFKSQTSTTLKPSEQIEAWYPVDTVYDISRPGVYEIQFQSNDVISGKVVRSNVLTETVGR